MHAHFTTPNRQNDHLYDMHAELRVSACRFTEHKLEDLQKEFDSVTVPRKDIDARFTKKLGGVPALTASTVMHGTDPYDTFGGEAWGHVPVAEDGSSESRFIPTLRFGDQ
eukprot:2070640-Amphidinium_carterae.1